MPKKSPLPQKPSQGEKRLQILDIHLPAFPLTTIGSLPKSSELIETKYRVSKGFQQLADLERKEKMAIEHWLFRQEKLGMDVLVDGELNRGDFIAFFADRIQGFEPGGLVRCYGNRYYKKPVIKGKLEWKAPLISDTWRLYQRTTHKPLKAILTGPYTLMDWSFNEYYSSRETVVRDLIDILKKEIRTLVELGAKIIQIDEPALSTRPQEFSLVVDAIKEMTAGLNAYFILHHSYGDLSPLWAKMQRIPVQNFSLETTNSHFSLLHLIKKIPTTKDITFGVIDSHRHNVETPQQIKDRIRMILRVVPARQVWFSPDCGLKTRTAMEVDRKLDVLFQCVQGLRKRFKK